MVQWVCGMNKGVFSSSHLHMVKVFAWGIWRDIYAI